MRYFSCKSLKTDTYNLWK